MAHKALVHSIQIHPTELQQPAPPKRGLLSFMRLPVPAGDRARSEKFLDLAFSPDSCWGRYDGQPENRAYQSNAAVSASFGRYCGP
jgi:hypothetical protein